MSGKVDVVEMRLCDTDVAAGSEVTVQAACVT